MDKKILKITICMAILAVFGFVIFLTLQKDNYVAPSDSQAVSATTTVQKKSGVIETSEFTIVPFDSQKYFDDDISVRDTTYTVPVTGKVISFSNSPLASRNPNYYFLLDGNKIGEFGGYVSPGVFSESNQYFALKSRFIMGCAGRCHNHILYVADLKNQTVKQVPISIVPQGLNKTLTGYDGLTTYIDSVQWEGDLLKIKAAIVGLTFDVAYYQIGSMETYSYNSATEELSEVTE